MARNFRVPKPLKSRCNSRELDQSFRRAYLPQLPLGAGRLCQCGLWDIQKACGMFSSQWEPWLLPAAALQDWGILADQSHAQPFATSPSWHGAIPLSSLGQQKQDLCAALAHQAGLLPGAPITHPAALTSANCEICCPGFERILRIHVKTMISQTVSRGSSRAWECRAKTCPSRTCPSC